MVNWVYSAQAATTANQSWTSAAVALELDQIRIDWAAAIELTKIGITLAATVVAYLRKQKLS